MIHCIKCGISKMFIPPETQKKFTYKTTKVQDNQEIGLD